MYTVLNLEHVLERCEAGLIWDTEADRPNVAVHAAESSEGPVNSPSPPARLRTSLVTQFGPPRKDELWAPLKFFDNEPWYSVGDSKAYRAIHRANFCMIWHEAGMAPFHTTAEKDTTELKDACDALPRKHKDQPIKVRYERYIAPRMPVATSHSARLRQAGAGYS